MTAATVITPTGVLGPRIVPGSDDWLSRMSASKIAAVLGISPFESPFSLYHRMAGNLGPIEGEQLRRGHYLEPAIAAWFTDQRTDLRIEDTGTWVHAERDWQIAAPDRLAHDLDGNVECVEIKSAADAAGWGDEGTDQIPVYVRAQVMWQLDTLGLATCHVAVLLPFLEFRAYVIRYDADEAEFMRAEGRKFLDRLAAGQIPPLDGSDATYEAVRELHPDVDPETVELDDTVARPYLLALAGCKDAEDEKRLRSCEVIQAMGRAQHAAWLGDRIATRIPGRTEGSPPYLRARNGAADLLREATS